MILVTGGAGYIGSHVCKKLYEKGYEFIVLDNLSKGCKEFVRWSDLIIGDVGDENLLDKIFSKYKIEAVIHFAAFIGVEESVKDPRKYYENNFCKTLTLLKKMVEHRIKYFIFSSSVAVYGNPRYIPVDEETVQRVLTPC